MSQGTISWISGPVLKARAAGGFNLNDAIYVGDQQYLGEVIRVDTRSIVAQIYEDTTGLRPGDSVVGTDRRLSVYLRPGLLGTLFDGLLRPLAQMPGDTVTQGHGPPPPVSLDFRPLVARGDRLEPGQAFGELASSTIGEKFLTPPGASGVVESIVPAGQYADDAVLCTLRGDDAGEVSLSSGHEWPVRIARPLRRRRHRRNR